MDSGCENTPAVLFVSSVRERRKSLTDSAQQLGLQVLSVTRCREARSVLRKHGGIEVVVVDVTLPDGNWCEVLRWIIDEHLAARVVLVSPVSDAALWSEAVWRGAYDVLVEPFTSWEFSRSIEGALRNRTHHGGASRHSASATADARRGDISRRKTESTSHLVTSYVLPSASPV